MSTTLRSRSAADTERAVLDLVRGAGAISRVELAERSGLTGASISRVVARLLDAGLLVEVGQGGRTGGKRRTLLGVSSRARHAAGLSVDAERLRYVLVNLRGEVVASVETPGAGLGPPEAVVARSSARMAQEVRELLDGQELLVGDVSGLGVAVPGRYAAQTARPGLRAVEAWAPLATALAQSVGLAVRLERDHVAATLAELRARREPVGSGLACLYVSRGFGLGIQVDGELHRGSSGRAGEVGHLVLDAGGPLCWCGSRGCLEVLGGAAAVVDAARAGGTPLDLTGEPAAVRKEVARVCRAAVAGDVACRAALDMSARYVAAALVSVASTLDLDRVVITGPGLADAGHLYADLVRAETERHVRPWQDEPLRVEGNRLGHCAAAIGAATLALEAAAR
ncbi:ROK family transcriptional regulator [Antribacter gilvus]|uniref:ROK family transcriptional regulator n=1 Tax=Antribacter gilvus TaxID=2304675 RepID=UPI0013DEDDF5|nr:ROK family transcriptional regulator [Antribacter gilvus]